MEKNCECSFEHVAFEVPLRQPRGNSKEAVLPLGSCSWNSTSPTGYAHQSPGHQGKVMSIPPLYQARHRDLSLSLSTHAHKMAAEAPGITTSAKDRKCVREGRPLSGLAFSLDQ